MSFIRVTIRSEGHDTFTRLYARKHLDKVKPYSNALNMSLALWDPGPHFTVEFEDVETGVDRHRQLPAARRLDNSGEDD